MYNPQKAVNKLFSNKNIDYKYSSVSSGVTDQPKIARECINGATNRAKNTFKKFPNADYCVGIEGGIEQINNIYFQSGWVVVINNKNEIGYGTSARAQLSNKIMKPILNDGKELSDVMDNITGKTGILRINTNNNVPRANAYA